MNREFEKPNDKIQLILARHAETDSNLVLKTRLGGVLINSELTLKGYSDALDLGLWLKNRWNGIDLVYASDLPRAQVTADIAIKVVKNGLPVIKVPELRERSLGEWEGQLKEELLTPEVLYQMENQGWYFKPPGGESKIEAGMRGFRWVDEVIVNRVNMGKRLLAFTHGELIRDMLVPLTGMARRMAERLEVANTSLWVLERPDLDPYTNWNLVVCNQVPAGFK